MADVIQPLLSSLNPSVAGTDFSNVFDTKDFRDFAFVLRMPTTTGAITDTINFFIEASSEKTFNSAHKIRTIKIEDPSGTKADQFTEVTGALSLPSDTNTATPLRQKWNVRDVNIDRFIRIRHVIVNTPGSFTNIDLDLLCNRKV